MKKFVKSMVYCLFTTLISLVVLFLLQAPLMTFVYYGLFSESNIITFCNNVINKVNNVDSITLAIMIIQTTLTIGFIVSLFLFVKKVIYFFLKDEKLIRPYYIVFFVMTSIIPVALIFISIFFKIKLLILTLIIEGVFTALNILILVFTKKILPDTTNHEYRKYLFSEGSKND